ncbi:MAG: DNA polymerase I [Patescibacteria group bacterium]|nr:DNA polymerase I [Patescibacteria group bacterium]MCL5093686.1 DNA polymerase I [Patescibacteria group bacterium]
MAKKPRFVIFDGNAVVHRAYHALPPLTTKDGEVVNAVYGFTMILLKVIDELKPDYLAMAFDLAEPTFRHKEYKEYKATREKTAEDLSSQFRHVYEVLDAFDIPYYTQKGYEADDIIGTLSRKVEGKGLETIIVTGDLDELQLVDENTKVYTMRRGFTDTVIYDEKMVKERYGLTPKEFIDFKALKGDPSDNIPGVPGIGEKTAVALIQDNKDLEGIYKNLNKLPEKTRKVLTEKKEQAFLSKRLSTIVTDMKFDFDLEKVKLKGFDRQKIFETFRKFEFKSLLNKVPQAKGERISEEKVSKNKAVNGNYYIVDDLNKLKKLKEEIRKVKILSVDTETTSLDEMEAELVGLCFSIKEKEGYYIPIDHKEDKSCQIDLKEAISELKPTLEDNSIQKVGHNLKYDYKILKKYGVNLAPLLFDSMVAAYILNPNLRAQSLSELSFSELGIEMVPITDLIGKGKDQICFSEVAIEDATQYAAEDADIALRLYNHLSPKINEEGLWELMQDIEMPLIPVLAEMEFEGVRVNESFLKKMSVEFEKKVKALKQMIWKEAGSEFNIASPIQLKEILFDKLKLAENPEIRKNLKKVKTGGFSTAAGELEKLRNLHPIINQIQEYRELTKLKSTYIDALPLLINKKTGRVHTSFNQTITTTGRLSSSNPNLQNIPIRTDIGNEIRKAFIAGRGQKLLSADYSQIELRIVAHIAEDKEMLKALNEDADIHTRTASFIFNVPETKVDHSMRRAAKVINFGVLYGMSPHGLSEATGMSREEAKEYIDRYFEHYKGIANYTKETLEIAKESGYVESIFGRKRFLPEINSPNHIIKAAAERMAINMPVQGSAADLMKLAMIDIDKNLKSISKKTKMLLQVHDELVFEVPKEDVNKVAEFVKDRMENVVSLKSPIKAEIRVGENWGELKKIK